MSARSGIRRLFGLKHVAVVLALLLLAPIPLPHHRAHAQALPEPPGLADPAQDPPGDAADGSVPEGFSLMEEGAKLLLRGLLADLEPEISGLEQSLREIAPQLEALGPQLSEVARLMGDFRHYDAPVMLENGDILIRRNTDQPPPPGLRKLLPEAEQIPQRPLAPEPGPSPVPRIWPQPGPDGQIDL